MNQEGVVVVTILPNTREVNGRLQWWLLNKYKEQMKNNHLSVIVLIYLAPQDGLAQEFHFESHDN